MFIKIYRIVFKQLILARMSQFIQFTCYAEVS